MNADLRRKTSRIVAALAAFGFVGQALFEVALALGAPWGKAAWGGTQPDVLPPAMRIASVVSAVVLTIAAALVLGRAGYWGSAKRWGVFSTGTWALAGFLSFNTLGNIISPSALERTLMTPISFVLALLCLVLALSGPPDPAAPPASD